MITKSSKHVYIRRTTMPNVLFVCTANRCRSPMAERLFIRHLAYYKEEGAQHWAVASAGTWAINGIPPDTNVVKAMADFAIDIRDHRSIAIDHALLSSQYLILVMKRNHQESLKFEFPNKSEQIYLLSQMIGQTFDIEDPFNKSLKDYQRVAREINEILLAGFTQIQHLAQGCEPSDLSSIPE